MKKGFILIDESGDVLKKEDIKGPIRGESGFKHYFYDEKNAILTVADQKDAERIAEAYCSQNAVNQAAVFEFKSSFGSRIVVERTA